MTIANTIPMRFTKNYRTWQKGEVVTVSGGVLSQYEYLGVGERVDLEPAAEEPAAEEPATVEPATVEPATVETATMGTGPENAALISDDAKPRTKRKYTRRKPKHKATV